MNQQEDEGAVILGVQEVTSAVPSLLYQTTLHTRLACLQNDTEFPIKKVHLFAFTDCKIYTCTIIYLMHLLWICQSPHY